MGLVTAILLILVGFVVGYFFQMPVLIGFTSVSIVVAVYALKTSKEIGFLIAYAITVCAVIANIIMWATRYLSTDQSWLLSFFNAHVLR
ncbi:MAG: hypothetical protein COV29_02500 [Candidatus Yanofskybacteria bacterium CG10_big_fil_rev_8_21_14_0_10_36_16]|uniref:Uncharacterized protein n=1 Tax=Candidatus Yanofskybacteria bacterium CG10_big_fil_rev_8_21_14_0_10_36_16 TaxID=1975096 RepID=A0A2J0Q7R3_9BACT|nr:MAG: hypothetical protein COV29_02500 [Candidatus Yanofskybacteria bacterium CG10_big_fil_rev_8_21_14_0_10_36_16]